jgi:hypothetical protein
MQVAFAIRQLHHFEFLIAALSPTVPASLQLPAACRQHVARRCARDQTNFRQAAENDRLAASAPRKEISPGNF